MHAKSDASNTYLVVLDAAAYAATHALDLAAVQPDFVPVSFYKLLGYPTGLGALLVRKEAARQLNKVYFGGGRCVNIFCHVICACGLLQAVWVTNWAGGAAGAQGGGTAAEQGLFWRRQVCYIALSACFVSCYLCLSASTSCLATLLAWGRCWYDKRRRGS